MLVKPASGCSAATVGHMTSVTAALTTFWQPVKTLIFLFSTPSVFQHRRPAFKGDSHRCGGTVAAAGKSIKKKDLAQIAFPTDYYVAQVCMGANISRR